MSGSPWDDGSLRGPARRTAKPSLLLAQLGAGIAVAVFVGVIALGAYWLLGDSQPANRRVVQISILSPPPPPPAPPHEVKLPEPKVEPPKVVVKDEVTIREPERPKPPQPAAAPSPPSGLDSKGSDSGGSIDLARTPGGEGAPSIGGGADQARFAWFEAIVTSDLQKYLQKNDALRKSGYRITLRVWISQDGRLERYELLDSSGDPALDRSLRAALDAAPRLERQPPADFPQPITLRVTLHAVSG